MFCREKGEAAEPMLDPGHWILDCRRVLARVRSLALTVFFMLLSLSLWPCTSLASNNGRKVKKTETELTQATGKEPLTADLTGQKSVKTGGKWLSGQASGVI